MFDDTIEYNFARLIGDAAALEVQYFFSVVLECSLREIALYKKQDFTRNSADEDPEKTIEKVLQLTLVTF